MPNPRRSSACDSGMRMLRPRALIRAAVRGGRSHVGGGRPAPLIDGPGRRALGWATQHGPRPTSHRLAA